MGAQWRSLHVNVNLNHRQESLLNILCTFFLYWWAFNTDMKPLYCAEQLERSGLFICSWVQWWFVLTVQGASGSISFRAISDYTGNLSSKELEVMLKGEGNIHGRVLKLEDFLQFFSKLCFKMNNNQFEDLMQEMMAWSISCPLIQALKLFCYTSCHWQNQQHTTNFSLEPLKFISTEYKMIMFVL